MNWNSSNPDSIYSTVSYQANYSELLTADELLLNSLSMIDSSSSIGITLSNGILNGITSIIDPSDAINKEYIINSKKPSGPVDSIQYNNNGLFNGSTKMLFSGDFNKGTLIIKNLDISDSVLVIGSSQITNIPDPIYDTQLASKNYVDNYSNYTNSVIVESSNSVTYTTVANTIVSRNCSVNVTDYVPTSENIVAGLMQSDINVNAASTINLTLSGLQTVDGVILVSGDLILVKDQTNLVENGVYRVLSGQWVRVSSTVPSMFGLKIYVQSPGTVNKYRLYTCHNGYSYSRTGIDKLTFEQITVLPDNVFYNFSAVNKSTSSTLIIASNTGTSIINGSGSSIVLHPNYISSSIVNITSVIPPVVSIIITNIGPGIGYLNSNFIPDTFQTNLAYHITNTFMIPGNSVIIENTSSSYIYTESDVATNNIIRNPGGNTNDGLDNLIRNGVFTIQNKSAFSINISGTNSVGNWTITPSPIIIGPQKVQKILLYTESGLNYATDIGQSNY